MTNVVKVRPYKEEQQRVNELIEDTITTRVYNWIEQNVISTQDYERTNCDLDNLFYIMQKELRSIGKLTPQLFKGLLADKGHYPDNDTVVYPKYAIRLVESGNPNRKRLGMI
jgi:hypothetical protein